MTRSTWCNEGGIDINGNNEAFNQALDEFLQEEKDLQLVDGVTAPTKGLRFIPALDSETDENNPPDIHTEYNKQLEIQAAFMEVTKNLNEDHRDIETCQEYLRHENEREEWDCETILSTYSTLDNHPSLIKVILNLSGES